MSFEVLSSQSAEPILLLFRIFEDTRGYHFDIYKKSEFLKVGINEEFVQDSVSYSVKGVIRGLNYQKDPSSQGRLVYCTSGEVLYVLVDIRKGSPNYAKWRSYKLSDKNGQALYIPPGFACGFLTTGKESILCTKYTREYDPLNERGVVWDDRAIGIEWGIQNPVVDLRDQRYPKLKDADNNFDYVDPYK